MNFKYAEIVVLKNDYRDLKKGQKLVFLRSTIDSGYSVALCCLPSDFVRKPNDFVNTYKPFFNEITSKSNLVAEKEALISSLNKVNEYLSFF